MRPLKDNEVYGVWHSEYDEYDLLLGLYKTLESAKRELDKASYSFVKTMKQVNIFTSDFSERINEYRVDDTNEHYSIEGVSTTYSIQIHEIEL